MTNMSGLENIIATGLNNPECAFYTGQVFGQAMAIKYLFAMMTIYFVFKLIDKLMFEPFIKWLKNKWRKEDVSEEDDE